MATLAIQIISALNVIPKDTSKGCNSYCIVKFYGKEIFRTELCEGTTDPVWQHAETQPVSVFRGKEKINNRSCFLERLEIEVCNVDRNNKATIVSMTKMHLCNIGAPAWYTLLDPLQPHRELRSRILISLTFLEEEGLTDGRIFSFMKLSEVLPFVENHHLYIDFDWAAHGSIGSPLLPALESGESVLDKRDNVHWDISLGSNAFGDRHHVACRGSLILTDIRIIFIPTEAIYPSWMGLSFGIHEDGVPPEYSEEQKLLIRRLTYIIPIPCLQDIKTGSAGSSDAAGNAWISFYGRDGSAVEFQVHKQAPSKMTSYQLYRAGLRTDEVAPVVWCQRVLDEINWRLKEGKTWVRFAKLFRQECETKLSDVSKNFMSIADVTQMVDIGSDFRRLRATEDWEWEPSTLNGQYKLCSTYPQSLYFPKSMGEAEVSLAAKVRSRNRLAALSWVHPETGIPLTRAAQPKTGIASNSDDDRRHLLAIASSSSAASGYQLRIIDARPYINAQANALRGKGFENVGFLGGPSVASLAFMDIHNIHVMRDSLLRLREDSSLSNIHASAASNAGGGHGTGASSSAGQNVSSSAGSNAGVNIDKTYGPGGSVADRLDGIQQSKWFHHISTVLRAAVTTADSILLNHPILVHCSDGWDRTAQLTGLTAIILDPFYRTIEGLFLVIEKEFVSFGHQFEHRCGKTTHKETSPVFLQFLDCVFQLVSQFPTKFEYSSRMLSLFASLSYSGLFISFNKNCEKDIMKTMSQYCTDDILDKDDLPYTSVYTYVRVLLYSSIGESLINPYYHPYSTSRTASVDYIRPKHGVSDMIFWEDGITPGVVGGLSRYHTGVPSPDECAVFMAGTNSRYLHYLQSHVQELPESVVQTLEYIHSSHERTLCPATSYRRNHQKSRHGFRNFGMSRMDASAAANFLNSSASLLISEKNSETENSTVGERMVRAATVKIQIWFRAINYVSKFCIMKNEYFYAEDGVIKDIYSVGMDDMVSKPSEVVRGVLRVFIASELKHAALRRHHKSFVTHKLVKGMVDDIIEDSLLVCMRSTLSDLREGMARKSRSSAGERLSDQTQGGGRVSAFTRFTGGFGQLLGKKIATGGIDFSDDEGESEDSDGDDDDVGIGVLGAVKTNAPRAGSSDGNFASRIFKFK